MRNYLLVTVGLVFLSNIYQVFSEEPGGTKKESESLPTPEKLLSHGGRYQESQYGQISEKEPEPAQNEGISSRKPRVNFVSRTRDSNTNNRDSTGSGREAKQLDLAESRNDVKSVYPMMPDSRDSRSFDLFHKNYPQQRMPPYPNPNYPNYPNNMYDQGYQGNYVDRYAPPMSSRDYYDNRRTYPGQEYLQPGMMPPPPMQDPYYNNNYNYPNSNYPNYYPSNKMYDMPIEQRQPPYVPNALPNSYPSPYPYLPPSTSPSVYPPTESPPLSPDNRNKRIIYYTTLPEVVRTPPNVNLNYHYDRYRARSGVPYDTYYERYNNRYNNYGRWIPQPDY